MEELERLVVEKTEELVNVNLKYEEMRTEANEVKKKYENLYQQYQTEIRIKD